MIDIPMNAGAPISMSMPQSQVTPISRAGHGGIKLRKGQKTSLNNASGVPLQKLNIGLYWDPIRDGIDLDSECFMLGTNGKVLGDNWFVYYYQLNSPDNAVIHHGDSTDGTGSGDDEVITIDLNKLDPRVERIVFVVTINEAMEKGLNFSHVSNAGVHVQDAISEVDICQFKLTEFYSNVISMMVGEVYRHNGQWKFNPIGDGVNEDLYGLCLRYGVNVVD